MRTKDQMRAAFALKEIGDTFRNNIVEDTSNYLNGVPAMILIDGLGQSLAFMLAKAEGKMDTKYGQTFTSLKKWLLTVSPGTNNQDLAFLTWVAGLEFRQYLQLQREALAYLGWLKRYARAFRQKNGGGGHP